MEEKTRKKVDAGMDIFVTLFILLIGGILLFFSNSWYGYTNYVMEMIQSSNASHMSWIGDTALLPFFISIAVLVYAVKRMINNILKWYS